ncbi:MAG: chemotaxis protein CheA [Candidatus Calescibacterium sp.]|nr:chemotaxis protein CheA [Candidatus Calescibacterium sp.]MCX7734037.1 chemotaxis protein CheA [bacterium]MDW8086363.1 chemotaxis protein CheA [Candidatus Calescibacterium sp.]
MADDKNEIEGWDETLKEYISQYIAEARDIIQKIEETLFAIEKKEGSQEELVNSLFRSWHTIKGAAGFLGLEKTVELSHKTESLMAKIRDEKISFTEDIINTVFDSLEKLKTLTENIYLSGAEGDIDISPEISKIDKIMRSISGIDQTREVENLEKKKIEKTEEEKAEKEWVIEKEEGVPKIEEKLDLREGVSFYEKQKTPEIRSEKFEKKTEEEAEERKEEKEEKKTTPEEDKKKKKFAYETIRVATQKIDEVLALSEELILERNFVLNVLPKVEEKYPRDADVSRLSEIVANMDKIISMLRFSVMKMRMIPLKTLFSKFPGTVRNLARHFGKKVELVIQGEDTELDRSIVDELEEPLIHLIRNSIDHGIERTEERIAFGKSPEGKIYLRAYYEGDNVVIEVEDDGRGIDIEKIRKKALQKGIITPEQLESMGEKDIINLIFIPGFSSKDEATELSGRGVGMDVVKGKIVELKGTLDVQTALGEGTKITMKLPLTVGIMNTLKVACNSSQFFIPLSSVVEITRISRSELKYASGQAVINWRNNLLPVVYLGRIFGIPENGSSDMYHLVVTGVAEKRIGILVDSVVSSEEIAVKTVSGVKAVGIAGATISAEGEPVLVIDIFSISKYLEERM